MSRLRRSLLRAMFFLLSLWAGSTAFAQEKTDVPPQVLVRMADEVLVVEVNLTVAATPEEVWAVLTDFDHMASYLSNLAYSQVLSREGDRLVVEQKGKTSGGVLSFEFQSVRELQLKPFELIRSHQLRGSMKKVDGTTRLHPEGTQTRIESHLEAIPNVWIPPILGRRFIESQTREQFLELRQEILRRKSLALQSEQKEASP